MSLWQLLLIVWTGVGVVTGILARKILGDASSLGQFANIVTGLVGGWFGGFLSLLALVKYVENGGDVRLMIIASIVGAIIGSAALVWAAGKLKRSNNL